MLCTEAGIDCTGTSTLEMNGRARALVFSVTRCLSAISLFWRRAITFYTLGVLKRYAMRTNRTIGMTRAFKQFMLLLHVASRLGHIFFFFPSFCSFSPFSSVPRCGTIRCNAHTTYILITTFISSICPAEGAVCASMWNLEIAATIHVNIASRNDVRRYIW